MDKKYQYEGSLITRTIEECAEVVHILCKIERFGMHNYHPSDKDKTPNWKLAQDEIKDLSRCLSDMSAACKIARHRKLWDKPTPTTGKGGKQ